MNYLLGVLALLLVGCNDTNKGGDKRRGDAQRGNQGLPRPYRRVRVD